MSVAYALVSSRSSGICNGVVACVTALAVSACAMSSPGDSGSVAAHAFGADTPLAQPSKAVESSSPAAATRTARKKTPSLAELARAHTGNPKDARAAIAYARALRASGKAAEAAGVLETAAGGAGGSTPLVVEQGLLALELGHTARAQHLLLQASPGTTTDWRVLSGLGVAYSGLGKQADAQRHFLRALELSPNNPAVLNNLALSYILERKVEQAEELLRRAAAGEARPRVAQNLALATALRSERGEGGAPSDAGMPARASGAKGTAAVATPRGRGGAALASAPE